MRGTATLCVAIGLGLFAGFCGASWIRPANGQEATGSVVTQPFAPFSHQEEDRYEMVLGQRLSGKPPRATKLEEIRDVIKVPKHYGNLTQITTINDSTVFWYNGNGVMRNVIVPAADARAYILAREDTTKREITVRVNK